MTEVKQGATQVAYPWKATVRTMIQVAVPTLGALALVLGYINDAFPELPPEVSAWIVGAAALLVSLAGLITRVMAIPAVEDFLTKLGLGATPANTITGTVQVNTEHYTEGTSTILPPKKLGE